jgi:hypothetical protein
MFFSDYQAFICFTFTIYIPQPCFATMASTNARTTAATRNSYPLRQPAPIDALHVAELQRLAAAVDNTDTAFVQGDVREWTAATSVSANTALQYKAKQAEFREFCKAKYSISPYPDLVTTPKLFEFMFYQTFRSKRTGADKTPQSAKKRKYDGTNNDFADSEDESESRNVTCVSDASKARFDLNEFEELWNYRRNSVPTVLTVAGVSAYGPPEPEFPVSYTTLNTYRAAIRQLANHQRSIGLNTYTWDQIFTTDVLGLLNYAKKRTQRMKETTYAERLRTQHEPYTTAFKLYDIEKWFWENGCKHNNGTFPSLRNRYVMLQTYSAVLRGESLFSARLADFFYTSPPTYSYDIDKMFILCFQMSSGKYKNKSQNWSLQAFSLLFISLQERLHITKIPSYHVASATRMLLCALSVHLHSIYIIASKFLMRWMIIPVVC